MKLSKSSTLTAGFLREAKHASHPAWDEAGVQAFDQKVSEGHKRPRIKASALLFLDQIKRDKGVWWMPRQQEAMKDVIPCDKLWGAGNRL
jgi:hypothetical protein